MALSKSLTTKSLSNMRLSCGKSSNREEHPRINATYTTAKTLRMRLLLLQPERIRSQRLAKVKSVEKVADTPPNVLLAEG